MANDPQFPWAAFLRLQERRDSQKEITPQDILGQALATAGKVGGNYFQGQGRKQAQSQLENLMNPQPIQGPPSQSGVMPEQPSVNPAKLMNTFSRAYPGQNNPFVSQLAGSQQRNQIQKVIAQLSQDPNIDPKTKALLPLLAQDPSLAGQILPGLIKSKPEWSVAPGMMSKNGFPIEVDKYTGEMKPGNIPAVSTGYGNTMGPIRKAQYTMQDLPSNQGPTTAGGAAYQVKVAARQGKSLIAKAGSAQRTGLASGDLARAVMRISPTEQAMQTANFSDNLITRWNLLKQKITADPNQVNNPAIRKELYSIFDEMDKSAEPWIVNQLDEMRDQGFNISKQTYDRQLGRNIPDIPFIDVSPSTPTAQGGWSITPVK